MLKLKKQKSSDQLVNHQKRKNPFTKNFNCQAALGTLAALGLAVQAGARPYHRVILSEFSPNPDAAACTFPDGSTPQGQAEMHCYNPQQFMQAYGIDQLHAQGITGKGQVIILVDSYGSPTAQADLDHFSDTFGLPRTTIQFIYPNGPYVNPVSNSDQVGWAQETTLDLEWSHAVAPDATIVNIISNSSETTGLQGLPDLLAGIQTATTQYPNAIVSMSFGTGEPTFAASDIQTYVKGSFHQIFQNATNANLTLLASAGDSGSTNVNAANTAMADTPNAGYPTSDPLVTSVGGTAIESGWVWNPQGTADDYWNCQINKANPCPTDFLSFLPSTSVIETVWKEDWAIAAGGGGISQIFSTPSYQSNLSSGVLSQANGFRTVPDVSMNAAINGGVEVYTSFSSPSQGINGPMWAQFGGTSCASPETAGLVALAGQKASDTLGTTVGIGYLNPILYSLPASDFNDIVPQSFGAQQQVTIDNNALYFNAKALPLVGNAAMPDKATPGYAVTKGYDMATGLGSPAAENFVLDIANARVQQESQGALLK